MGKRLFVIPAAAIICVLFAGDAQSCTTIMVGRNASADGSVMTSHTCDGHRDGTDIVVVPKAEHPRGSERQLSKRHDDDSGPMPRYDRAPTGRIAEAAETFGYLAPEYAAMNQRQVAIGESTFGGRAELVSVKGLIDCDTLTLPHARTREQRPRRRSASPATSSRNMAGATAAKP